jgi:hypothetical protein
MVNGTISSSLILSNDRSINGTFIYYRHLFEKNPSLGIVALGFATQHAAHLGVDILERVRKELLVVAGAFARNESLEPRIAADLHSAVVSAAFYLYSRGACTNRYERVAALLEELVTTWPSVVGHCKKMVDMLVDGLPNSESRLLWRLQVKMRAI